MEVELSSGGRGGGKETHKENLMQASVMSNDTGS